MTLKSGNSFYFTVPSTVSMSAEVMIKGAEAAGGYIARQNGEIQDLFVADGFSAESVSIKMNFKASDNGIIIVNKTAGDAAGSRYLAGAEFNLYYRESSAPANSPNLTITTSKDGLSRSVVMGAYTQLIATFKVAESGQVVPTVKTVIRNGSYYTPKVSGSAITKLPVGTYTLVEVKAPDNGLYRVSEKEGYDVFISASSKGAITIQVEDPVVNDPLSITITKSNAEGEAVAGSLSLEGTVFEIKHYEYTTNGRYFTTTEETDGKQPDGVWYLEALKDKNGAVKAKLDDLHRLGSFNGIKSSELPEDGNFTCGTLVIKEVKAAEGYILDSGNVIDDAGQIYDKNVYIGHIKPDSESESGASLYDVSGERCFGNSLELGVTNAPVRGDFTFKKMSADDGSVMADVEFDLILLGKDDDGNEKELEAYVIKTGTDGSYSSADDEDLWFTGGSSESSFKDKSNGSLVYGTYILRERRCEANESYTMAGDIRFTINSENECVNLGEILNYPHPYIQTREWDDETKDHLSMAGESVTVKDTVSYFNLPADTVFTLKGVIMEKLSDGSVRVLTDKDGNPLTSVRVFTTESGINGISNGSVEMKFSFNGCGMDGKTFVIYEYIYEGESRESITIEDGMTLTEDVYRDADGNMVCHADCDDEEQMGYFPSGYTTALGADSGDHTLAPKKEVSIVDTVTYSNLIPGKEYSVRGTLMDRESGDAVTDAEGNRITETVSFVAEKRNGSIDVTFTFDSSEFAGKELVAFEEMFLDGVRIFVHADIDDEEQTVRVKHYGSVEGIKTDADTGEGLGGAVIGIFTEDTVEFTKEAAIAYTTTLEDGSFGFNGLLFGSYLVHEIEAPEGYYLSDVSVPIVIDEDGEHVKITIVNAKRVGGLRIIKTSSNDVVEGFTFLITGCGMEFTAVTDENGEIYIENLPVGEYTVHEVDNMFSSDYDLPEDKKCLISENTLTTVTMHNVYNPPTVKETGDGISGYIKLLIGAAAVIVAIVVKLKKR